MSTVDEVMQKFADDKDIDVEELRALFERCVTLTFRQNSSVSPASKPKKVWIEELNSDLSFTDINCNAKNETIVEFLKANGLKSSGVKAVISERAYRFLQGTATTDDLTPSAKVKVVKPKVEKHQCCATIRTGAQCSLSGTNQVGDDEFYCSRHYKM